MDKDQELEARLSALRDAADAAPTPPDDAPPPAPKEPRQPPNIDDAPALRRVLSGRLRADDSHIVDAISGRLRSLKDIPLGDAAERGSANPEVRQPQRAPAAELVFTAGPRAGEHLPLTDRTLALDRDARETPDGGTSGVVVSIWAQGARFMLRHNNGILVGGVRPSMPVLTLDDGDELAWADHRLRFHIEEPSPA
jgi:hypothetical protein